MPAFEVNIQSIANPTNGKEKLNINLFRELED